MSGLVNRTGAKSGVIGGPGHTKQIDMMLPLVEAEADNNDYGTFNASSNFQDSTVRCSGVVPKGFVSLDELWLFVIAGVNGSQTLTFGWECSTHDENYANHSQAVSLAASGGTQTLTQHDIYRYDLYNKKNDGADLEDVMAYGDAFAIEITSGNGQQIYGINIHAVFTVA